MRSFKISETIHKKEGGSYYVVSAKPTPNCFSLNAILNHTHFGTIIIIIKSCAFSGMSNSGKTAYIKQLLEMAPQVFTEPPSRVIYFYNIYQRVIYFYNIYQDKFAQMEDSIENISFFQGLPQRSDIEKCASSERHLLLVFDDLYQDVISSRDISDLTIMLCHHLNASCIFTSHNIFAYGKCSKTIATNLHYILLMQLRIKLQLTILSTQLFCYKNKSRHFVALYDAIMNSRRPIFTSHN